MRIFGRRDGAPDEPDEPVASYAAVLDGVHLWWHVEGHDRLTLRAVDGIGGGVGGGVGETEVDVDPFPLAGLVAPAYDALAGGRPVLVGPLPERRPARAPLTPDGRAQYDVADDGGRLRLVRAEVPATATLVSVGLHEDEISLRVQAPDGLVASALLLVDEADAVAASVPLDAGEARLGVADLPAQVVGVLRVVVGTADGWVRVRRLDTGLADPNHAVLLPELAGAADPDRTRARLRWSPDSLLALRLLDPRSATGADST